MKRILCSFFGIGGSLFMLSEGCSGISNADQIVFPADSVSYSKQVEPFFTLACNASGCHNGTDMAGNVSLATWQDIVDGLNGGLVVVDVAHPQYDTSSILDRVLFGDEPHAAPLNVNENQRDGIRQWIFEGAKEN
jgi:hypothetical protein